MVLSDGAESLICEFAGFRLQTDCVLAAKKISRQAMRLPMKIENAPFIAPSDAAEIPVKIPDTEPEAQNQTSPADRREI